ncbi:spore cortex biosynthesis protein YabQ [Clostridium sp. Ade.TY]|uniref:spore cortex biosynthesis protein YabQ n=1 Tax=Clostridium sp. Ade.TY TaxID=1391647 RepID=UPI000463D544|nr:spore cortex biosynthesis protein YabQ [Clostridium sp. Ade.TY]
MPLELEVQFEIIIYALASGIIVGVLFDIYRIIRGNDGHKIIIAIQDILFWLLCSIIIFIFLLYTNYAFLGTYVYLCMGLALFIYLKLFSGIVYRIESTVLSTVRSIIRCSFKTFSYPIRIMWSKILNKN